MKWKFFNVPLGVNAPSGALPKCAMDWATAGGLVGDVLSFIGNERTNTANMWMNDANIKAQQEENRYNREWQRNENKTARDWQEYMWNQQNEYNTPSAQRKRLQEAGYNPWISGSGGPQSLAGSAGSASSNGPSMNQVGSSIAVQNSARSFENLGALIGMDANIANQNAQTVTLACKAYTEYLKSTGDYKGAQKLLKSLLAGVNRSDRYVGDLTNSLNQEYIQAKIKSDRDALEYEIRSEFGKREASKQLDILDKTISKLDSEIELIKSNKHLSDQEAKESAQRVAKMIAETDTIDQSRDFIVKKLQYEADILENDPMRSGIFSGAAKSGPVLQFIVQLLKLLK